MPRKREERGFDPMGWMFTFSDLVTLLLTFFVMLMAMRHPEVTKLKAAFGMFQGGDEGVLLERESGRLHDFRQLVRSLDVPPSAEELAGEEQTLALDLNLPGSPDPNLPGFLQDKVTLKREERGVVLTLANDLLFPPGGHELTERAKAAVAQVAEMIKYGDQPVSVEGHTDDQAPRGVAPGEGNWQLSLKRALVVLRQLAAGGVSLERLQVAALADSRPLVPNDSAEHRTMNRRTEIVLLNM